MTATALPTILAADGSPLRRVTVSAMSEDGSAYKAASRGLDMRGWNPSRGSADVDLLPEKDDIDARARDLTRNEPVAKSGVNGQLEMVVATGATLHPIPDYKAIGMSKQEADAWSRDVESKFHEYADSTDIDATRQGNLADLTRLFYRTKITVGEGAALPLYLPDGPGSDYALAIQNRPRPHLEPLVRARRGRSPQGDPDRRMGRPRGLSHPEDASGRHDVRLRAQHGVGLRASANRLGPSAVHPRVREGASGPAPGHLRPCCDDGPVQDALGL
ncbi:phage portal protein [Tianweitania sediminis]|uniref:Phage portal protein n=1 Tax=Tianweitania sediminis TaxID=1502156 RepID=A0A8J7RML5_9HYPH|nr:phage portal protein [Tianweitania sediminis]